MFNLAKYPTPIAGLTLGMLGISAYWKIVFHNNYIAHIITLTSAFVATLLVLPLILRLFIHPKTLVADLQHPTIGSVIPTLTMTLMMLSNLLSLHYYISVILWLVAIIIHIIFLICFTYYNVKEFNFSNLIPSWYVPPIGIVVACLTVPSANFLALAHVILWFGLIAYFIMLPVMLYRLSVGELIADATKPTLAILAAPASLTLAGYLTISVHVNPLLVIALFGIAVTMTIGVYLMLLHLLKLPFSPAYSAFTFPTAISATASLKFSFWTKSIPMFNIYFIHLYRFSLLEGIASTLIILYVLQHYLRFIAKNYFYKSYN